MAEPFFSVIVPVYNKGELLRRTLDSALKQDFGDYEIIVIDDGSTDDAFEIMRDFKDERVHYHYQPNSGLPAAARNSGIKRSTGKYVAFLDADDIWYPKKLSRCRELFARHPEVDVVCHDEAMKTLAGRLIRNLHYGPYEHDMSRRLLFNGNRLSTSATVVRRQALVDIGAFRERADFFSVEDYDLWIRLAKKSTIYFIPEILGEYLMHDANISTDAGRHFANLITVIKANFAELEDKRPSDYLLMAGRLARMYLILTRRTISPEKYE